MTDRDQKTEIRRQRLEVSQQGAIGMDRPNLIKNNSIYAFRLLPCLAVYLLLLQGCGALFHRNRPEQTSLPRLNRILVLPMDRASIQPGQEKASCSLSDVPSYVSPIPQEASDELTRLLVYNLHEDKRFVFIPKGRCLGLLNSMLAKDVKASQLQLIQAFGRDFKADAVLYGKIFRYEDRIGKKYGVKRPASVAFTLYLIRVKDGVVLWHNTFDETQQPLMENLFKARLYRKSGMHWLTARELADYGLTEATNELKGLLLSEP